MSKQETSLGELIGRWKALEPMASSVSVSHASATADVDKSKSTETEGDGKRAKVDGDLQKLLIEMLTTAVALEFSTIPPYLCALWSVVDELHPVAKSIREVAQEEMLHMGLACNMLVAVGGRPKILENAPRYPSGLPGKVHEGLIVNLQGLNKEALLEFLRIESPGEVSPMVEVEDGDPSFPNSATIGEFYRSILEAFKCWNHPFVMDGQVTASLVWRSIGSYKDVESAIGLILDQGEGAELGDGKPGPVDSWHQDLAHYYRFLEVFKEKRLLQDKQSGRFVWTEGYKMPDCLPMAKIPAGGYNFLPPEEVSELLFEFNSAYTEMLRLLEQAWDPDKGGQGNLVHAIGKMFSLERPAKALMRINISEESGTYGPDFRILPKVRIEEPV